MVCPVALTADSAASVCFRQLTRPAWSASHRAGSEQADSNQADSVCQVGPRVDPDGACFRPALSVGWAVADSAGLVSRAYSALRDQASAFPDLDCPVFRE